MVFTQFKEEKDVTSINQNMIARLELKIWSAFLLFLSAIQVFSQNNLDSEGWTILDKANSTKILYVSSTDGNDGTAVVYNPNDSVIGSDPIQPTGTVQAFATVAAAANNVSNGEAAWILLKRGDTFFESLVPKSGASPTMPFVYASYGSSNQVPLLKTGSQPGFFYCCNTIQYTSIIGLSFYAHTRNPDDPDYIDSNGSTGINLYSNAGQQINHILFEGNIFRFYISNVIQGPGTLDNIVLRRNLILDNYSETAHSQGLFAARVDGMILDDNIFDHNGWYKQSINSDNSKKDGQATIFNHNTYFALNHNITFSNNSFYRPSSVGTKWTADEGPASTTNIQMINNFFHDCEVGISIGGNDATNSYRFQNITISDNVLSAMGRSQQTNRTLAWYIWVDDWDGGIINDNFLLHQDYAPITYTRGIFVLGDTQDATIENNILYNLENGPYIDLGPLDCTSCEVRNNELTMPTTNINNFVNSSNVTNSPAFSNNTYVNATTYNDVFRANNSGMGYTDWLTYSGESTPSTVLTTPYPDPTRSFDRYVTEVLGLADLDAFYTELRNISYLDWRPTYTAENINEWIKLGFRENTEETGEETGGETGEATGEATGEETLKENILVYNFGNGNFQLNDHSHDLISTIEVFGPNGGILKEIKTSENNYTIEGLSSGLYFFTFKNSNNEIVSVEKYLKE